MTEIAAQLILHPTVSETLKVLGTTVGRDKVYRAVQNFARFLAWYLISKGYSFEAARWNALKNHLAIGRKMLRLGKPLEHLQVALKTAEILTPNMFEQLTTIGRQVGYAGYLTYDAFIWANTVRLIILPPERAAKYNKLASRFWLAGILFSICHAILKTTRLTNESKQLRGRNWAEKSVGLQADSTSRVVTINKTLDATRYQFIIDLLDIWLPAYNLGLVNVSDGFIGICGVISSIMGFRTQWAIVNKV